MINPDKKYYIIEPSDFFIEIGHTGMNKNSYKVTKLNEEIPWPPDFFLIDLCHKGNPKKPEGKVRKFKDTENIKVVSILV